MPCQHCVACVMKSRLAIRFRFLVNNSTLTWQVLHEANSLFWKEYLKSIGRAKNNMKKLALIVAAASITGAINTASLAQDQSQVSTPDNELLNRKQTSELELASIQDKIIVSISR